MLLGHRKKPTEGDSLMPETRRNLLLAAAALTIAGAASPAHAGLSSTRVASGLSRPVYVAAPDGDDRLFIVEQRGIIKVLENGAVLAVPFLDIDALVPDISGNDERGLLGMAFHPGYAANGRFYLDYVNLAGNTVIASYAVSANPNVADPASAAILLTIDQPFQNHKGGTIQFGPLDGYLYIGMGDGGSGGDPGNRAQSDDVLLGKMLRIDVDGIPPYAIPSTNPFAGPGLPLDEIWAKGVRNPYRWSFDRLTGDLWIADVGQSSWEEIDFEPAGSAGGRNYGWRLMEGTHCYQPATGCNDGSLILPIYEYSHDAGRCSVTGGCVYRGSQIPSLAGTYLFADFCSDQIWSFRYDGTSLTDFAERTGELAPGGGLAITDIAAIAEDGHGEVYIVDRGTGSDGEIYKIGLAAAGLPQGAVCPDPRLSSALPNPFVGETSLRITLPQAGPVEIAIADAAGRIVRDLAHDTQPAGEHLFRWDGRDDAGRSVPSGVYFARCSVGGDRSTQRLLRIR
jgi:glucose/arabinose dehydrogenase